MAYRVGHKQGSCNDNEHRAGYKVLKALQHKKLKDAAVFIVRLASGQRLGPKRFNIIVSEAEGIAEHMMKNPSHIVDTEIPDIDWGQSEIQSVAFSQASQDSQDSQD